MTHSTLLFVECVDTIKPSVSVPDFETETLYFFRFFKDQYSLLVKKTRTKRPALSSAFSPASPTGAGLADPNSAPIGGGERDRTDDLLLAKQALSQLSYTPDKWWVWMDLNHRPHAYQACALTN